MTLDVSVCRDALKKAFINHAEVDLLKAIIYEGDPENDGRSNSNLLWCICGCCRHMPLEVEKFAVDRESV